MVNFLRYLTIVSVLVLSNKVHSQWSIDIDREEHSLDIFADLSVTPVMGYTIQRFGSNIPTSMLAANGVKANMGGDLGLMFNLSPQSANVSTPSFICAGYQFNFLGFKYGGRIISLDKQYISNNLHSRLFLGFKYYPTEQFQFFSFGVSVGYGNITANYESNNINGRIKARTFDVSLSAYIGISKHALK